ncbi:uncharacterized protein LOC117125384 [Anneissia japonica]|uniref:uncharacterized protein LOC117125384 n=1 Tax=Anneissia japonica TaxID=1529436 RepID=UPI001425A36F|nr:uncharacterized protein LOC117125384 [Anneissia japonica]
MCLQEVEEDKFFQVFQPEFRRLGFSGVFKKRTGEKRDGCAIFYRDQCFQLEKHCSVEYYQPGVYLLDRDNIGLIVILKSKLVPSKLCVATTHLLFNPKRGDVKLAQLSKLFAEIDKVSYETSENGEGHCPIILCGDFNSEPNSPLYRFIVNAFLDYSNMFSGDVCRPLGSSNPQKRGFQIRAPLLPKNLGITRSCQYVDVVEQRNGLQEQSTAGEGKCEDKRGRNKGCEAKIQVKHPGSSSGPPQQVGDQLPSLIPKASGNAGARASSSKVAVEAIAVGRTAASSTSSGSVEQAQGSSKNQHNPPKHELHHNLDIESSYQLHDGLTTTHHCRTNCVVDFMFHSRPRKSGNISDLKKVAWLPLFTDFESNEMGGLPNKHWSSDHYRLQVKFMLCPPSTKP